MLPLSEFAAEVKRPPVSTWIAEGRLPDSLLAALGLAAAGEKPADDIRDLKPGAVGYRPKPKAKGGDVQLDPKSMPGLFKFGIELARESFVWPKIVDEPDPESDDEIAPGHLSMEDIGTFLNWTFKGCKGLPVQTTSGPVSVEALHSFREDAEVSGAGDGGASLRAEAESSDRAAD